MMCFVNDYDWTAEVSVESTPTATKTIRCRECWRQITIGTTYHSTYLQEHEECHTCYEGECECPGKEDGHDCACGEPDFGEIDTYNRCCDCFQFLKAVEAAEIAAGCHRSEALPLCGEMIEQIGESGQEEAEKYFRKAAEMFPSLEQSGYIEWLKRKMFPDEWE